METRRSDCKDEFLVAYVISRPREDLHRQGADEHRADGELADEPLSPKELTDGSRAALAGIDLLQDLELVVRGERPSFREGARAKSPS